MRTRSSSLSRRTLQELSWEPAAERLMSTHTQEALATQVVVFLLATAAVRSLEIP